ncbi:MAG: ribosome-associated translation inhibitor RaiA [Phycisphaerales bacterium]|nr:ribosome-associated translation inhibitor RaiA [Phycisphaerales bacterium]
MMRITVTGRHMDLSSELKSYATEKTSKLERYYDRVQSVEVVFDRQAGNHSFECEIIAKADHHMTFVAKEQNEDPYAALDASSKELEGQLRRHKEKFRNRKHPNGLTEKEPLGGSSSDDLPAS